MAKGVEKYSKRGLQTSYVSVVIGISLVLLMLGLVAGAYLGLENLQKTAKENIEVDLFFFPTQNDADIKLIEQELKQMDGIKFVWYVSSERALEIFEDNEEGLAEIQEIFDGESPFPPSLTFHPKDIFANKEGLKKISADILATYPNAVSEVNYDEARVEDVNLGFLRWVFLALCVGLALMVIAFALINNTIRLSLYSSRFTIKTMQLVGAKSGFIRKPFLWNSILQGIISAIIGMALLIVVFYGFERFFENLEVTYDLKTLLLLFGILVALGVFISFISTWFALNKYLRKKLDDLY